MAGCLFLFRCCKKGFNVLSIVNRIREIREGTAIYILGTFVSSFFLSMSTFIDKSLFLAACHRRRLHNFLIWFVFSRSRTCSAPGRQRRAKPLQGPLFLCISQCFLSSATFRYGGIATFRHRGVFLSRLPSSPVTYFSHVPFRFLMFLFVFWPQVDRDVRQAAAIALKNTVRGKWSPNPELNMPATFPPEHKATFR